MNEPETPVKTRKRISFYEILIVGSISLLCFLFCAGVYAPLQMLFYLGLGWLTFISSNVQEAEWTLEPWLVGIVALMIGFGAIHFSGQKWLLAKSEKIWSVKNSLALLVLTLILCVSGFSAVGLSKNLIWAWSDQTPWSFNDFQAYVYPRNQFRKLGDATRDYHEELHFLPGYQQTEASTPYPHSWQTHLLPYLNQKELSRKVRMDLPWNHPENKPVFTTPVSPYSDRYQEQSLIDDQTGYALTHISGNSHLFTHPERYSIESIPDGASNTILAGEIKENLPPWGKPGNWRDPMLGINKSPHGFGRHGSNRVYFLMADGSVQSFNEDVPPQIFKALSTPAGGEEFQLGRSLNDRNSLN
ncbi:MAG: DUF1559 domain-containing protein [Planctomycetaceae bacterium]